MKPAAQFHQAESPVAGLKSNSGNLTPPLQLLQDIPEPPESGVLPQIPEPVPTPAPTPTPHRPSVLARNVFVTLAAQLVSWAVTFLVTLYVPRYIGAAGFGILNVAAAFASITSIGAALGTSTVLVREIARDHTILQRDVAAGLALRLGFGIVAVLVALAVAAAMDYSHLLLMVVGVSLISMLIAQLADVLNCSLQGLERMPQQNAAFLASRVIIAALQIWAVVHHMSLLIVAGAGVIGTLVNGIYAFVCLMPFLRGITLPTRQSIAHLFRSGLPFVSIAIFSGIYGQSDVILLSKLCSLQEAGWYGLARQLIGTTLFIPVAVCSAMMPTLSRLYLEDRAQFIAMNARAMNLMLICVTPFVALLVFAPTQILAFLHYPPSFAHSIPVLMAMAGAALMWYVSQVAATALIASDRQNELSRATSFGAVICIPVSVTLILITRNLFHNGAVGAAISNGLVECVIFSFYARMLPPGIINWSSLGVVGRSIIASLPLVAWLYLVHDRLWFAVGAVPCVLIYAALCWTMKCFHKSDVEMLRQMARRKIAA